ncbi:histone-fold-containing protein [Clavulina sp. PMI_390]|nr:histone-fold-containing protein [Clavulina sp. PMI_390]
MADNGHSSVPDEELTLPRATVTKLINDVLPQDMTCSRETRDLIIECCIEFIHLVSSQANEICDKESRKTISPEHIMTALEQLEFEHFLPEIKEVFEEHKSQAKERGERRPKLDESGLNQEELYQQQQALFAQSKARFDAGAHLGGGEGPGPSEES